MMQDVWRVCKMMHDMVQWDLSNGVPVAKIENLKIQLRLIEIKL